MHGAGRSHNVTFSGDWPNSEVLRKSEHRRAKARSSDKAPQSWQHYGRHSTWQPAEQFTTAGSSSRGRTAQMSHCLHAIVGAKQAMLLPGRHCGKSASWPGRGISNCRSPAPAHRATDGRPRPARALTPSVCSFLGCNIGRHRRLHWGTSVAGRGSADDRSCASASVNGYEPRLSASLRRQRRTYDTTPRAWRTFQNIKTLLSFLAPCRYKINIYNSVHEIGGQDQILTRAYARLQSHTLTIMQLLGFNTGDNCNRPLALSGCVGRISRRSQPCASASYSRDGDSSGLPEGQQRPHDCT
jgi:hypothetical protein